MCSSTKLKKKSPPKVSPFSTPPPSPLKFLFSFLLLMVDFSSLSIDLLFLIVQELSEARDVLNTAHVCKKFRRVFFERNAFAFWLCRHLPRVMEGKCLILPTGKGVSDPLNEPKKLEKIESLKPFLAWVFHAESIAVDALFEELVYPDRFVNSQWTFLVPEGRWRCQAFFLDLLQISHLVFIGVKRGGVIRSTIYGPFVVCGNGQWDFWSDQEKLSHQTNELLVVEARRINFEEGESSKEEDGVRSSHPGARLEIKDCRIRLKSTGVLCDRGAECFMEDCDVEMSEGSEQSGLYALDARRVSVRRFPLICLFLPSGNFKTLTLNTVQDFLEETLGCVHSFWMQASVILNLKAVLSECKSKVMDC